MKSNKFISLLLVPVLVPLLSGCGNGKDDPVNPTTYKYVLVENGSSDYEIVYPDATVSTEASAANIFASYIQSSTGVSIPVVNESNKTANKKYISFGETKLYKDANLNLDKNKMNFDGYGFKNVGSNLFVIGGYGTNSYSYSALELLHKLINFEGYCDTEIDYDVKNYVGFDDIDLYDAPTFANRNPYNSDCMAADDATTCALMLRANGEVFSKWGTAHTAFKILSPTESPVKDTIPLCDLEIGDNFTVSKGEYAGNYTAVGIEPGVETTTIDVGSGKSIVLPNDSEVIRVINSTYIKAHPDWFTGTSNVDQWCWSNEDLYKQVEVRILDYLDDMASNVTHIFVSQMDGNNWCTCDKCQASNLKYGTNSAVVVKFINKLADAVKARLQEKGMSDRHILVGSFAYKMTESAPVKYNSETKEYQPIDDEVILRDNAFIRIAPINAFFGSPFTDPENARYEGIFRGWKSVASNILVWNYNTNFSYYMFPFQIYNSIQENYKFMKECNVSSVFEQGAYNSKQTGFMELKNYITSKLAWNADASMPDLIDDFFTHYYKDASTYVRKYFDELRLHNEYVAANKLMSPSPGSIYADFSNPAGVFTLRDIKKWEGYLEKAKEAVSIYSGFNDELYDKLIYRIEKEEVFFLYVKIMGYASQYSDKELLDMKKEFKRICEKCGIYEIKEGGYLTDTYAAWGI